MRIRNLSIGKKSIIVVIIVVVVLVSLYFLKGLKPINNFLTFTLHYPMKWANQAGVSLAKSWQEKTSSIEDLTQKNKEQDELIKDLKWQNSQLKKKLESLDLVTQQSEFAKENKLNIVSAKVIAYPLNDQENIIVINKGSVNDVKEGQAVIVGNGIIIGKIIETSLNSSQVRLLVDQNSKTACQVQNDVGSPCVVVGEHNLSLIADLIPQTDNVIEGQEIITSGLEGSIPKGLFIGSVEKIEENKEQLFKKSLVKTLVNYNFFEVVSVITSTQND